MLNQLVQKTSNIIITQSGHQCKNIKSISEVSTSFGHGHGRITALLCSLHRTAESVASTTEALEIKGTTQSVYMCTKTAH